MAIGYSSVFLVGVSVGCDSVSFGFGIWPIFIKNLVSSGVSGMV